MISRSRISTALLGLGIVLLLAPALAPVQPILYHDVDGAIAADPERLEDEGIEVIAYENLSERGKELYERALRNGGSYRVPAGKGAPDFQYRAALESERDDDSVRRYPPRTVAIKRPDDPDFPTLDRRAVERRPPASERREAGATSGTDGTGSETENGTATDAPDNGTDGSAATQSREREQYNFFQPRLDQPPLTDSGNLFRFLAVLLGVVAVGGGGYLRSKP